ncbi:MAG: hypothetical protein JWN30_861, partial [Bacilli bacterium]|nr:hypothetical protein [Bacilli bacterium]
MLFVDQVAIVTGASQGIGFAAMKALSNEGAKVIALSRNPEVLKQAIDELSAGHAGSITGIPIDVRNEAEVQQAIAQVLSTFGKIDILINSAGVSMRGKELVQEVDLEEWKRILDTNLTGTFLMSREVLPAMVERNSGYIINILSTAAYRSSAGDSIYAA